jgi:RNA polymerase sigma-70 factor (ECF subfamily)
LAIRSNDAPKLRLVGGRALPRGSAETRFDELTDAELVTLAGEQHDAGAFALLYRRHSAFALTLSIRIQGNATDVEDIVHDAFLRAHARLGELRDGAAFRAWLGSIVVRLVRTRMRRRRLLGALGLNTPDPVDLDAIASPAADSETRVLLAQVYALLQTLPADERIAWTLRHIERHGLEAVAELTECSLATAKRRIQRAQRFLADHFVAPFAKEAP